MSDDRVKTGIYGLDRIIEGGFRNNTSNVIVGASGTGKSTFAMQYVAYGLENGEQALYVSMEEPPEQIMNEAEMMGLNLKKYYNKSLFFIHMAGKNFKQMIEEQLPKLVKARTDYDVKTRVAIDPMTPVIWAVEDKQEQRELISKLFYTLKKVGVIVATVEEHTKPGETIGEDVLLPIYLADGVVHLDYQPIGGAFNRTMEIIKMRGTHHGEGVYPYIFSRGAGVIIRSSPEDAAIKERKNYDEIFDKAVQTAKSMDAPESLILTLNRMKDKWDYSYSPEEMLEIIFDSYGIKN